jgi:glucose/arabinose dehydrogenase
VTAPAGDARRLFVVEKRGTIVELLDGVPVDRPFLDISDRVKSDSSEPGLLSLAFAPDFSTSGVAYVFYTARKANGDVRISSFRTAFGVGGPLDPATERILLEIQKPWENHNGGMLQFGPDGMLYASVGDGDSGVLNPPGAFAQTRDDLLGNILRIDTSGSPYAVPPDNPFVGQAGIRPEIWAYGLRNPWRFWIDAPSGRILIGDVGAGAREEIDLIPRGEKGLNFGWPCFEGSTPFDTTAECAAPTAPVWEQSHGDGSCSVIAGVVIHDPRLPALDGRFLYGDYCTGKLGALSIPNATVVADDDLGLRLPEVSSFGVDGSGRVHLVTNKGLVYRLDPA